MRHRKPFLKGHDCYTENLEIIRLKGTDGQYQNSPRLSSKPDCVFMDLRGGIFLPVTKSLRLPSRTLADSWYQNNSEASPNNFRTSLVYAVIRAQRDMVPYWNLLNHFWPSTEHPPGSTSWLPLFCASVLFILPQKGLSAADQAAATWAVGTELHWTDCRPASHRLTHWSLCVEFSVSPKLFDHALSQMVTARLCGVLHAQLSEVPTNFPFLR